MNSIIQDKKECLVCGSWNVEDHHIYFGQAKRKLSEKYGLKVWLCPTHHRGTNGVHGKNGHKLDMELKQLGQKAFEWEHTREEFLEIFCKNYID
jgi:hypothetical protein